MNNDIIDTAIRNAITDLLPYGAGPVTAIRLEHALRTVAVRAMNEGKRQAYLNIMPVAEAAAELGVTPGYLREKLARHGAGMKIGSTWLVSRDELPELSKDHRRR